MYKINILVILILKIYSILTLTSIYLFLDRLFSLLNTPLILNFNSNIEQFDIIFHSNKSSLDLLVACTIAIGLICFLLIQAKLLNLSFYPNATFDSEKYSPYECGFSPFKTEWSQFDIKFYLVALLFLVFDVELMFLLPYCLSYYYLGLTGYIVFVIFFSILLIGFLVEWATGMLIWKGERVLQNYEDDVYTLEIETGPKLTTSNYMHLYVTHIDNKILFKGINKFAWWYWITRPNRLWFWRPYYTRGYVDKRKLLF